MSVTGSKWQTFRLLDLVKGLEPDNVSSYIDKQSAEYEKKLSKLTELSKRLDELVSTVSEASVALTNIRSEFDNLVGSALSSGVYFHVVGIDGRLTTNDAFVGRVEQHLLGDLNDPNRPDFVGESSRVGGGLILIGAPSPAALRQTFVKLGSIFPVIYEIIGYTKGTVALAGQGVLDIGQQALDAWQDIKGLTSSFGSTLESLYNSRNKSLDELFDGVTVVENRDPNKWYAQRLTDLIPALDPKKSGSIGNMLGDLLDTADSFAVGLSNNANGIALGVQSLQSQIYAAQVVLVDLKKQLSGLITDAAQTGIYLHWLGEDKSLKNNNDFATAVKMCFSDRVDKGMPNFQGRTAVLGGLLLFIGAPSIDGLGDKFNKLFKVFES